MKIWTINNKKEEAFLRKKTADFDFSAYSKKELQELLTEMKRTMREAHGAGLSANQVGLNARFFIAEIHSAEGKPKFYAIFNPKLEKKSKETEILNEGCLSVPGIWGDMERSTEVVLTGFDKNEKRLKIKAWGLLAQVFQHEVDHLDGKLFTDKARNLKEITGDKNNGQI